MYTHLGIEGSRGGGEGGRGEGGVEEGGKGGGLAFWFEMVAEQTGIIHLGLWSRVARYICQFSNYILHVTFF